MKSKRCSHITPGEILDEEFLKPMAITPYRLAKDIGVPPRRINEIVNGQRAIAADIALRLGRYFGTAPEFWLNLQTHYDLEQQQERLAGRLDKELKVLAARATVWATLGDGDGSCCSNHTVAPLSSPPSATVARNVLTTTPTTTLKFSIFCIYHAAKRRRKPKFAGGGLETGTGRTTNSRDGGAGLGLGWGEDGPGTSGPRV